MNHRIGKPWVSQFPRRADGGWKSGRDIRIQQHAATCAAHSAEFAAKDGFDPEELALVLMDAMSKQQETIDMLAERYNIDLNVLKAQFIKANADGFIDPTKYLDPNGGEQDA